MRRLTNVQNTSASDVADPAVSVCAHQDDEWVFWIDVGGTFTDCIALAPNGGLQRCKVLSTGAVQGAVGSGSGCTALYDPSLPDLAENFFRGYDLHLFDHEGDEQAVIPVSAYDAPARAVYPAQAIPQPVLLHACSYELRSGEVAPALCMRMMMKRRLEQALHPYRLRLGTTIATNTLLERTGPPVVFAVTSGFADVLEIGDQTRPHLFEPLIRKPPAFHTAVVEIHERTAADGDVLLAVDPDRVRGDLRYHFENGIRSIAICFINAFKNPLNEQRVATVAREVGFTQISVSNEISPTIKYLSRSQTAVVDAYLSPAIHDHISRLRCSASGAHIHLMTSAGGIVGESQFGGKDSILSGPAGGVVGYAGLGQKAGYSRLIGFDMGGTSTDVSRFDGRHDYLRETQVAGVRIVAPSLRIETVAAGGGSICAFDGHRLTVGPRSAGARPGPACYGRGGPLTLTDINLYSGRLVSAHFPFALVPEAAERRLKEVAGAIRTSGGPDYDLDDLAAGFTRIANERMAAAVRSISTSVGCDPGEYALVPFGGAGGQHACAIASLLGIRTIIVSRLAGILSAHGVGTADVIHIAERSVLRSCDPAALKAVETDYDDMEHRLFSLIAADGIPAERIEAPLRTLDLRYIGEEATITVNYGTADRICNRFEKKHLNLYGHSHSGREIEIAMIRVERIGTTTKPVYRPLPQRRTAVDAGTDAPVLQSIRFANGRVDAAVKAFANLQPGDDLHGPALLTSDFSTVVVEPGWQGVVDEDGNLLLHDTRVETDSGSVDKDIITCDPVQTELFNNRFKAIATRMGLTLQRTSVSVNVKERLDFSCAILDAAGNLVVNAPHIPVHLGAVSETVKALLRDVSSMAPGDVYLSNAPDTGGSHLPDLTVITPVFDDTGKMVRFFTASRAHHAEIGGRYPGSLFPFARRLDEEGVVFRNFLLASRYRLNETALRRHLGSGPYPSRNPKENIMDLRAAMAANQCGVVELQQLGAAVGWRTVMAYMDHICHVAEAKTCARIRAIPDGCYTFTDALDCGAAVCVSITISDDAMSVDFDGSGPVNDSCLNAPLAVVQSALLYCIRFIVEDEMPLNSGMLVPLNLNIPGGMLNPSCGVGGDGHPAVAGGNVELSQRVVDVVLAALGVAAASQGTMNNLVFGNDAFGYYETLCGGGGAGPGHCGASAVHTHMTNTRLTDVEILEQRYPIRVREFLIRTDSGGEGLYRGGDGVMRELEFLDSLEVSLVTDRRVNPPFGLAGGGAGRAGRNALRRCGTDAYVNLPSLVQFSVGPGDILRVETPGGGGYGERP